MASWKSVFLISGCVSLAESFTYSYTFTNYRDCLTECKPWKGEKFYCWTSWSDWDYCNPGSVETPQYYTAQKRGEQYKCESLCGTFGYSYNWCWTDVLNSKWDYCSRDAGKSSKDGYTCFTPCQKNNEGIYSCFAISAEEDYDTNAYCSPQPYDSLFFDEIAIELRRSCGKCKFKDSCSPSRINKRQKEWQIRKIGVENLVRRYERRFETVFSNWDPITQAVVSFVRRPAPPISGEADVNLTMAVRAIITPSHVRHIQTHGRDDIPHRVKKRMKALQAVTGDEQGHLLAASLGGPTQDFNFAPQSRALNRRVGSDNFWYPMEGSLREFLTRVPHSRIEWTLVVAYNLSDSRRPTMFGLNVREYDEHGNLICDSNDCVFSNDPHGYGPIM